MAAQEWTLGQLGVCVVLVCWLLPLHAGVLGLFLPGPEICRVCRCRWELLVFHPAGGLGLTCPVTSPPPSAQAGAHDLFPPVLRPSPTASSPSSCPVVYETRGLAGLG